MGKPAAIYAATVKRGGDKASLLFSRNGRRISGGDHYGRRVSGSLPGISREGIFLSPCKFS
jgi:hypothetical protein